MKASRRRRPLPGGTAPTFLLLAASTSASQPSVCTAAAAVASPATVRNVPIYSDRSSDHDTDTCSGGAPNFSADECGTGSRSSRPTSFHRSRNSGRNEVYHQRITAGGLVVRDHGQGAVVADGAGEGDVTVCNGVGDVVLAATTRTSMFAAVLQQRWRPLQPCSRGPLPYPSSPSAASSSPPARGRRSSCSRSCHSSRFSSSWDFPPGVWGGIRMPAAEGRFTATKSTSTTMFAQSYEASPSRCHPLHRRWLYQPGDHSTPPPCRSGTASCSSSLSMTAGCFPEGDHAVVGNSRGAGRNDTPRRRRTPSALEEDIGNRGMVGTFDGTIITEEGVGAREFEGLTVGTVVRDLVDGSRGEGSVARAPVDQDGIARSPSHRRRLNEDVHSPGGVQDRTGVNAESDDEMSEEVEDMTSETSTTFATTTGAEILNGVDGSPPSRPPLPPPPSPMLQQPQPEYLRALKELTRQGPRVAQPSPELARSGSEFTRPVPKTTRSRPESSQSRSRSTRRRYLSPSNVGRRLEGTAAVELESVSVGIVERPLPLSANYAVLCPVLSGSTGVGVFDDGRPDDAMSSAVARSGSEQLSRSRAGAAYRGNGRADSAINHNINSNNSLRRTMRTSGEDVSISTQAPSSRTSTISQCMTSNDGGIPIGGSGSVVGDVGSAQARQQSEASVEPDREDCSGFTRAEQKQRDTQIRVGDRGRRTGGRQQQINTQGGGGSDSSSSAAPTAATAAAAEANMGVEQDPSREQGDSTSTQTMENGYDGTDGGDSGNGQDAGRGGVNDVKVGALRAMLAEAVRKGHGGAALKALQLLVGAGGGATEREYVQTMEACMSQGSWTSGLECFRLLLEDLRPRKLSPSQATWRSLARGLRSAGQADQGVTVLRQALEAGLGGIDEPVCSILLDLCAVKGRMGLAEEISSLMDVHGIQKGPVAFCVLLKGYGRQRRLRRVLDVMQEMKTRGVVPDVVALNAVVDAFVRCGELWRARKVLSAMEASPGGSQAQTWTYNTLIKGLGRELLIDEAFEVARGMVDRGCYPDEVTTNSLVDICVRCGDLDRAYKLLKNPTSIPPPSKSSVNNNNGALDSADNSTISRSSSANAAGLVADDEDSAENAARTPEPFPGIPGLRAAEVPDAPTPAVAAVTRNTELPTAAISELISEPVETGSTPGSVSSTTGSESTSDPGYSTGSIASESVALTIASASFRGRDISGSGTTAPADSVVFSEPSSEPVRSGLTSEPVIFPGPDIGAAPSPLSSSSSRVGAGQNTQPDEIFKSQEKRSSGTRDREPAEPRDDGSVESTDVSSVNIGDSRRGRGGRGGGRRQAAGNLVRPSVEAFTSVLTGFAGVGDKDRALAVFQQMVNAGVEPNLVTYTALISACVNAGDMDDARRLFGALEARGARSPGMQPSVFTYNTLIRGLCRTSSIAVGQQQRQQQQQGDREKEAVGDVSPGEVDATPRTATSGDGARDVVGDSLYMSTSTYSSSDYPPLSSSNRSSSSAERSSVCDGESDLLSSSPVGRADAPLPPGIQEALKVLLSMRRRGVQADEITMNEILDGLVSCAPPRIREAEAILKLMSGWGLKPNQVSFTVMLKGYGRAGDLGGAEVMFSLMCDDKDQKPDVVALNSLLDACVRNGDLRRAVEVLEQSLHTAKTGRPVTVPGIEWPSCTGRAWGENASSGALKLAAAASATGPLSSAASASQSPVLAVTINARPNQVSFATVVQGLARRGDAPAGRKAISLYERMRWDLDLIPDEGMIDGLMSACCNAQAGEARGVSDGTQQALYRGTDALRELLIMGWDEEVIQQKQQVLLRVLPTVSEVWKVHDNEDGDFSPSSKGSSSSGGVGKKTAKRNENDKAGRKKKASAEIFEKYGWNSMDSHFPIL